MRSLRRFVDTGIAVLCTGQVKDTVKKALEAETKKNIDNVLRPKPLADEVTNKSLRGRLPPPLPRLTVLPLFTELLTKFSPLPSPTSSRQISKQMVERLQGDLAAGVSQRLKDSVKDMVKDSVKASLASTFRTAFENSLLPAFQVSRRRKKKRPFCPMYFHMRARACGRTNMNVEDLHRPLICASSGMVAGRHRSNVRTAARMLRRGHGGHGRAGKSHAGPGVQIPRRVDGRGKVMLVK